jgi:hypothetical protein
MHDGLGCQSRNDSHWKRVDLEMEEDQDGAGRTSFERANGVLSPACVQITKHTHTANIDALVLPSPA